MRGKGFVLVVSLLLLAILPATALAEKPGSSGSDAKVTICHRASGGWVSLTIPSSAWKAHEGHGDFVAGASHPCPPTPSRTTTAATTTATTTAAATTTAGSTTSTGSATTGGATAAAKSKVAVCHRTGSTKKPWVLVRVSGAAWKAHQKHGDFLVTSSRPCPPAATTTRTTTSALTTATTTTGAGTTTGASTATVTVTATTTATTTVVATTTRTVTTP